MALIEEAFSPLEINDDDDNAEITQEQQYYVKQNYFNTDKLNEELAKRTEAIHKACAILADIDKEFQHYTEKSCHISSAIQSLANTEIEEVSPILESLRALESKIQEHIPDLKQRRTDAKRHIEILRRIDEKQMHTCGICLKNPIDTAAVPCGHTICEECLLKTQTINECFVCRQVVTSVMKLYFL
tara:strand:- start:900 stop:1457 length:558 start_codon:yes stop_codon:yes gene_type:complete